MRAALIARVAFLAGLLLVAACETPNFFAVWSIRLAPSATTDADLVRLDELASKWGFTPRPIGRGSYDTREGTEEVLRNFQLANDPKLRLGIGRVTRTSALAVYVTDLGRADLELRGASCRKYLEILTDLRAAFGPQRIVHAREACDTSG